MTFNITEDMSINEHRTGTAKITKGMPRNECKTPAVVKAKPGHVALQLQLLSEPLPYLIWHPSIASKSTYRELARLKPEMKPQIIAGNYDKLFEELLLDFMPDRAVDHAEDSSNWTFQKLLRQRLEKLHMIGNVPGPVGDWKMKHAPTPNRAIGSHGTQALAWLSPMAKICTTG
ncbi:hypothetical protein B0T25DRAFT_261977 [Lasiosphaeria hispida]|uniref:Uncharacterized protein n=1 Tax=Lasiosphaeria hispida TaxID=260671 RepID=A0AAJ0HGJ8_9PEZI|nr:hypothetical protein B0T25DRAFT_261977 [Lasiosphaeria hispida]